VFLRFQVSGFRLQVQEFKKFKGSRVQEFKVQGSKFKEFKSSKFKSSRVDFVWSAGFW